MKSLLLVVMGLLLIGSVASAAPEVSYDGASGPGTPIPAERDIFALTQNASTALTVGIYTCGNVALGYTTDGWALRRMSPVYEFDLVTPFVVTSVDWGVRRYCALLDSVPPLPYYVNVELYTMNETDPFVFSSLTLVESVPVEIAYLADAPIAPVAYNTVFNSVIDPIGKDLVVAIHYPEGYTTTPATRFSPAGNTLGETMPGYVVFADCGYAEPITPGELGSAVNKVVFVVNGHPYEATGACCVDFVCTVVAPTACTGTYYGDNSVCDPTPCPIIPVENKSWGQVKSLYR